MKFQFNKKTFEEFRQDLKRASWVASTAIFGSGFFGSSKNETIIGAALVWMGLQLFALLIGSLSL
ncbi:MAG: hypothetical protein KGI54_13035 [Pseudomonadota bacterium]|nr:hypothetical protein [Pseudomonadota bacterium]